MSRCTLCECQATTRVFGFRVCDYHATHGEDDPPCPICEAGSSDGSVFQAMVTP